MGCCASKPQNKIGNISSCKRSDMGQDKNENNYVPNPNRGQNNRHKINYNPQIVQSIYQQSYTQQPYFNKQNSQYTTNGYKKGGENSNWQEQYSNRGKSQKKNKSLKKIAELVMQELQKRTMQPQYTQLRLHTNQVQLNSDRNAFCNPTQEGRNVKLTVNVGTQSFKKGYKIVTDRRCTVSRWKRDMLDFRSYAILSKQTLPYFGIYQYSIKVLKLQDLDRLCLGILSQNNMTIGDESSDLQYSLAYSIKFKCVFSLQQSIRMDMADSRLQKVPCNIKVCVNMRTRKIMWVFNGRTQAQADIPHGFQQRRLYAQVFLNSQGDSFQFI